MLPLTRSRNRARFFGTPFSPEALFAGGTVAGAWYDPSDPSTLFTTSAGTTPVAMPGLGAAVPVGLMLDKSQGVQRFWSGYFDGAGDYLACGTNSAFAMGSGDFTWEAWVYFTGSAAYKQIFSTRPASGASSANGSLARNPDNGLTWYTSGFIVNHASSIGVNTWVHVAVARQGTTLRVFANGTQVGSATNSDNLTGNSFTIGSNGDGSEAFSGYISNVRVVKGTAVYTGNFTPPSPVTGLTAISGTSLLTCQNSTFIDNSSNAFAITVNGNTTTSQNIPLGNHAIAFNDTTARPELRARVNLLTYSEEFDNGVWSKTRATVTANATTAPDGTLTADKLVEDTNSATHLVSSASTTGAVFSVYAKAAERSWIALQQQFPGRFAYFDLTNGVVGTSSNATGSIESVGNGWFRCTITVTSGASSWDIFIATGNGTASYTGNGTSGVFLWGAQLIATNAFPANTYQRIADANTYDTSGFPLYLRFDGIDDSMYTPANLNLSGTDKVAVFAGVRKLGTTLNMVTEFSSNVNNGTFYILGNNLSASDYGFSLRGTAQAVYLPTPYVAPISNVLAVSYDIAGAAIADEIVPRINGVIKQNNPSGSNAGTGNFGTYPLYIGSRNNAEFGFNGHLYSLIIAGSAVSAGNISATEQWVANKTGIVIP